MDGENIFAKEHESYARHRAEHWDKLARRPSGALTSHYRNRLAEIYSHVAGECESVLELGCGRGELLKALNPREGVGVDLSEQMIVEAQRRHPKLQFICGDAQTVDLGDVTFDMIILSDLLNDLWDVQAVLMHIRRYCSEKTRIVLNVQSHVWESIRRLAQTLGLVTPVMPQNWLTPIDVRNLVELSGFDLVRRWEEVLSPLAIPLFARLCDRVLVRMPFVRNAALANFYILRIHPQAMKRALAPTVSVIIAARNEAGHIDELLRRIPEMGSHTEIIFVEGNSTDDTYGVIKRVIADSVRDCRLLKQPGKGKGDAVRTGFEAAKGDILMILDADITVPPEDLPRFFDVLSSGIGEFANGVRLVYSMEDDAMRFFNVLGNKFFGWAFGWLLGQPIRDTLCGTKVLWASDYRKISRGRSYFGDFDPFGDFDLLFGAARLNLKIVEVPIRYRKRRYGETNIQRWRHGWLLLKMVVFAARRIKFR
ncbi:MAG: glycosyl transferase [Syntrophaceae bacterium CG2_30_49_12]|nr:MAG: glycosyl transferase [Syntrophaceae bacterium CG2_30_49_12]PJC73234.1 MAG: glycosyl transferase [Syntrophobacterales bacterium CG_4_8_14_3_um_filter_49_14]